VPGRAGWAPGVQGRGAAAPAAAAAAAACCCRADRRCLSQHPPSQREVKVLVVGDGGVGKTSLIRRFCTGAFAEATARTVGVDFLERLLPVPALGQDVRLFCWDTAGQEEFGALTRSYFRGGRRGAGVGWWA
jgi:GTPase SAR1 family protein